MTDNLQANKRGASERHSQENQHFSQSYSTLLQKPGTLPIILVRNPSWVSWAMVDR